MAAAYPLASTPLSPSRLVTRVRATGIRICPLYDPAAVPGLHPRIRPGAGCASPTCPVRSAGTTGSRAIGVYSWDGDFDGAGRIALQAQAIDWSGSGTWYSKRDMFGVGAACQGDSGGPAIHTSFGFDMNFGVQVSNAQYAGHFCPSVEGEHQFRYVNPGKAGAWIQSTVAAGGGLCTDFQYNNIWHYLRCW